MRPIIVVTCGVVAALSVLIGMSAFIQAEQERSSLSADLQYRSRVLADSIGESVTPALALHATTTIQRTADRVAGNERLVGVAVVDSANDTIARSNALPVSILTNPLVGSVMDSNTPNGTFMSVNGSRAYVYVVPLHDGTTVVGALIVAQNAEYIDSAISTIWWDSLARLVIQSIIVVASIFVLVRWVFLGQVRQLTESVRRGRRGEQGLEKASYRYFEPVAREIRRMSENLRSARQAASEEARLRLEKIDEPWTEERLKHFTKDVLSGRQIVVVSSLEPYIHTKQGNGIAVHTPASGLITAIEPVMQACGGLWIAQGSGDADKLVVDAQDSIAVPPEEPKYTLKRVWLTEEEVAGYSNGFADRAMYPLCHMSHIRPVFHEEYWKQYKIVNEKFARTVLAAIDRLERPLIFIQDFQFMLMSRIIKHHRPDAAIGIFWHIPWVSAEAFSICPWKEEVVDGMLGADLLGFHTQQHCNNFIETVSRVLEARIDYEQSTVTRHNHTSYVKPFPISIAFAGKDEEVTRPFRESPEGAAILERLGVHTPYIGVGADRFDYIKGLQERLRGIEVFLDQNPQYCEQFTFIQISAPSETTSKIYLDFVEAVTGEVERINARFGTDSWKPILFLPKHHRHEELKQLYKLANFCLVSSLHDGMNLVAKEFVASRSDLRGSLILSEFAGAAKEMRDAFIVNPYNSKETANAIRDAIELTPAEQEKRMKRLRDTVKNYNIYRWSAEFIKFLAQLD